MKPLRLLLLHQGAELYGSDRVLLNLVSFLAGRGHEVLVVLPEEGPLADALRASGAGVRLVPLPVIRRGSFRGRGVLTFLGSLAASYPRFRREARRFGPHAVITNTSTLLTGALWCLLNRRRHVWLLHEIFRGRGKGHRLHSAFIGLFSDLVVAPSRAVADALLDGSRLAAGPLRVIPNGILAGEAGRPAASLRERLGLGERSVLAGVAGRFNWWKGQREMVPAMRQAADADPELHFVFVGGVFRGDEQILEEFRGLVGKAGLEGRTHVLGEIGDMSGFYAGIDLLVLPSVEPEPFGLVLIEAMAAGLPVVAYAHGGPAEIVDSSSGLLAEPRDTAALAEAILRLAGDADARRRMGEAGRRRVLERYTADRQGAEFEGLLKKLLLPEPPLALLEPRTPFRLAIMGTRGVPASYGGFETFAEELSARLADRGHDVTVYGRSHHVPPGLSAHRGARLAVLPSLRTKYLDTVFHAFLSTLHGLFAGYDAVLMCNSANSFACAVARLGGAGVLINVDGLEWQRRKWNVLGRWWYLLGERLASLLADRVVADAEVIRDYYLSRHGTPSFCIPYGAPDGKVAGTGALGRFGLRPDGYLLYVSRLEPENNAHVVVEAHRRLKADLPLVVVGDAPYSRAYIERLKSGAGPGVVFTGYVFGEAYRELQSHCFAYVQATEVGGTHPALIEGMGMASAVVANDTPENREAAADGALFYRRNDPSSLAELLDGLILDPGRRSGLRRRALAVVRERYGWERVTDLYEAAVRDILAPR